MIATYLERGVAAGAIAGLAYGLFVGLVANPLVEYMEEAAHHGHDHGHGQEHAHAVAETTTAIVSIGSGILWGVLLGGLFGLAYYFLEPSLPGTGTVRAYVLAGAGFLTVSAAPWLVLPPAAPGADQALGTSARLTVYATLMGVGALVSAASVLGYRRTISRGRLAALVVAVAPIAILGAGAWLAAPTVISNGSLSRELVAAFRGTVVLSQAALWAVIAGSFGWLHRRSGNRAAETYDGTIATNA